MKGVVLAGGSGSRLSPLTRVTNKHLLPIYDKPMIYYPLQTLVEAGIQDILIVTGGNNAGDFLRLLRNGKDFGLKQLSFAYQEGEGGIADALRLAEPFAAGDKICVILGDNILENSVRGAKEKFEQQEEGGLILLKKPSGRGEFEITDVNNSYLNEGKLSHGVIEGGWTDAGTFESLWRATKMVREKVLIAEELKLSAASAR